MIDELRKQANSKDGLLVLAWNVRLAQIFPNLPDEEKYQPVKILIREDSVHVYAIWNDGLPAWTSLTIRRLSSSKKQKARSGSTRSTNRQNTFQRTSMNQWAEKSILNGFWPITN